MSKNVGSVDRIIRLILGVILIALVFVGPQTEWGWLGLIFIVTAFVGFCPAYRLLGINSCSRA
jgi:ABC-type polysaccharide/polyol phosphate export permease